MSLETDQNVAEQQPQEEEEDAMEDFFNKKAKKGKKKKKKAVEIGGESTETSKTKSKKESTLKVEPQQTEANDGLESTATADEEWREYEEDVKDYSDLKIQNLQISETPIATTDEPEPEYNEAGELLQSKASEGPWNKTLSATQEPQVTVVTPTVMPAEPVKVGAYRPPSMRSGSLADSGLRRMRPGKHQPAPEINNVMDFPTLSAAALDKSPEKGFQVVKGGAKATTVPTTNSGPQPWRSRRQQQQQPSGLRLDNSFSALNSSRNHY